MADDLFEELDRFQQSIQGVRTSDAFWSPQEQDNRALQHRYNAPDTSTRRHGSSSLYWPSEAPSPPPILDAFEDRELLNQPDHSSAGNPLYRHHGYRSTEQQPTLTAGLSRRRQGLRSDQGPGQVNALDPSLPSTPRPHLIGEGLQRVAADSDHNYLCKDRGDRAILDQNPGLPYNLPLDTSPEGKLPGEVASARSARSIHASNTIKPGFQSPIVQGISLIATHELPDRIRAIFPFPLFNAVQSKCFKPIFETNDNFVLSAPTGSGKTGVLELAICRLMTTSANDSIKIVYQAPTKSLCSERQRDWQSKFGPLGLQCAELTGDTAQNQLHEVQHASIIITTPEKWDSITRKWRDRQKLMQMIKLFLIDEVHILKEERGATLEAVVSRMKSMGSDVRFVAISATIPNSQDIATWLGKDPSFANVPAEMARFGEAFRPVKLQKHVCGYQGGANDFGFDKLLNGKLPEIIVKWSQRKPLMVFCSTRKSCVETAKLLSNWWTSKELTDRYWGTPRRQVAVVDKDLQGITSSGVAFHHAGMSSEDRSAVEKSYLEGNLSVICCTSTLAIGVNLPCHMVIIKGTVTYQGQVRGACREYSDLEIMQMLGRAGRPQFDASAVAVIMTRSQRVLDYEKMITGQEVLESSLHRNLIDHINAEIGLGTVTDPASAKKWLMGTFLYVRLKANPKHYQLDGDLRKWSVEEQLENFCKKAIFQLEESQLVVCEPNPRCTEFGDAMARYCVRFDTMKAFVNLPTKPKVSEILSVISQAAEFKEVRIRPGDKTMYRELNKNQSIKFPVNNSLDSPAHKISLIIQCVLGAAELPTEDAKVRIDFQTSKAFLFSHINRLIRCIVDCQLHLRDSIGTRNALALARSLGAQVWDDSPLHLKQLEGIGLIGVRKLVNANIKSVEDFQTAEAYQIERALSRNPPWGSQLQSRAATFPRLYVSLTLKGKPIVKRGQGVTVRVKVDLGFLNEKVPGSFQRKAIYVCVLVDTTAGDVVHFGRIGARKLGGGQDVLVSVNMTSFDQAIRAFVMCDEIAGTAKQAILKPDLPANSFPPPQLATQHEMQSQRASNEANTSRRRTSNNEEEEQWSDEFDGDQLADEDLALVDTNDFKDIDEIDELNVNNHEPQTRVRQANSTVSAAVPWEPRRLENGNWACNHLCNNKKTCKHRCCQEGLDKKPKPPKQTNTKHGYPNISPTQRRLDQSLTTKPGMDSVTMTQYQPSTPTHKRALQTARVDGRSLKSPDILSSTFIPPRTTTQNRSARKVIPVFKKTDANLARPGRHNVEIPSSSDYGTDDLDPDLIQDSPATLHIQTHGPGHGTGHDYDDNLDERMSVALPSIEGIESIDLSNDNDMNSQPLRASSTALASPSAEFDPAPRGVDADRRGATDTAKGQGIFVSDGSDFSLFSEDKVPAGGRDSDKATGEEVNSSTPPNKRQKLSNAVERDPGTVDKGDKNDSTVADPGTKLNTTAKSDHELDLQEWFHRHLGTEKFNFIG